MAEDMLTFKCRILDFSNKRNAAFKSWKSKWTVSNLTANKNEYQCVMLRYPFSDEIRKIYETLNLSKGDKKDL